MQKAAARKVPAGIPAIRERFLALNRERLRRTFDSMLERQRDFLNVAALLFHANHPTLPGFVSKQTPVGISDYAPSQRALDATRKLTKSFDYKRRALPSYDIHALFLMGSGGTVAYSQASDFDIWICHRPGLSPEQLDELEQKARLIEQWAATLDLEVHFFLVDPIAFKTGQRANLSKESSGTAQQYLLLEEFYRTGLLLAGRYPLWWLVPPEHEADYENYINELRRKRFIKEYEGVDFGPVARVPAEEFFGAALWQLSKGIDSPYKSVLKLLLMEVYASEYPEIDLLCLRFKRAIYGGEIELDSLDPYIMLYRKIEEHLVRRGETERLELVRRCFYFKVNERMGLPDHPRYLSWRRELMRGLVSSWGWDNAYLELLDARPGWKINRVLRERKILVSELTDCYKFLSDFAREHTSLALINQRDITIIGRKLYAAFERKAGKVEVVNRGISDSLLEERVALHQVRGRDDHDGWELFLGPVTTAEQSHQTAVKRCATAAEVLVWTYLNGLIDNHTAMLLHTYSSDLGQKEIHSILGALQRLFPLATVFEADIEELDQPAVVHTAALFINVGVDPLRQHSRRGQHITTARTDALSFSGLAENLALSFDLVILTTWKEVLTFHYTGVDGLLGCLRDYLQWASPRGQGHTPPPISAFCYSSPRGLTISKRVEQFFADVIACYYGQNAHSAARYLFAVAHTYYALMMENGLLRYRRLGSQGDMMRYLGQGLPAFSPAVLDRYSLSNSLLPAIFQINQFDVIQLVFLVDSGHADVWVVDERGSLFNQRIEIFDRAALINHFRLFFAAIMQRQHYAAGEIYAEPEMEFYEAIKEASGRYKVIPHGQHSGRPRRSYFNVQVISSAAEGDRQSLTIYCNDAEFTSLEYGNNLFREVAAYVLQQRRGGQRYPIYITDIDLPRTLLSDEPSGHIQTIHFLNYKKHIEQRLNEALTQLDAAG